MNNFSTETNQLCSVGIKSNDDVRTLLLLSSLTNSWDELVTAVKSLGNIKLNFEDIVRLVLDEEVHKNASRETSNTILNVETRGRGSDRNSSRSWSKSRREKSKIIREKDKAEC